LLRGGFNFLKAAHGGSYAWLAFGDMYRPYVPFPHFSSYME